MKVILYEPEIPPNTGNIARLCAAFGTELHLIEPLGFSISDKRLKRAGLDYWPHVQVSVWPAWRDFYEFFQDKCRLVMATTKSSANLQDFQFEPADALVFGPETRGLPAQIRNLSQYQIRIPFRAMEAGGVRSLNLATACGIILYTALAQCKMLPN